MTSPVYTAIAFEGFIEKSRKLKDLYGGSFVLSYLSDQLCRAAQEFINSSDDPVVSPALINVAQGTPNQILIRGKFPYQQAHNAFSAAWTRIVETCCLWIETQIPQTPEGDRWKYEYWYRSWQA